MLVNNHERLHFKTRNFSTSNLNLKNKKYYPTIIFVMTIYLRQCRSMMKPSITFLGADATGPPCINSNGSSSVSPSLYPDPRKAACLLGLSETSGSASSAPCLRQTNNTFSVYVRKNTWIKEATQSKFFVSHVIFLEYTFVLNECDFYLNECDFLSLWFGFYSSIKNILLISSQLFIHSGRKPEYLEKNKQTPNLP